MKNALVFVLLFCLLGSACTPSITPATPSGDDISTQVAVQLTALPTATTPPTPTPELTQDPTVEPLPLATQTTEPSPTPTNNPTSELGEPTWRETFDSSRSFGIGEEGYEDDFTSIEVDDGALKLTSKTTLGALGWRTGGPKTAQNAVVEGIFEIGTCSGRDRYGLVLRSPDFIEGYLFTASCEGDYSVGTWKGDAFAELSSGTGAPGLLTGSNQVNRLSIRSDGPRFSMYANGQLVLEIEDSTFPDGGHTGAAIAGAETQNFTVSLTELAFWNLPG